MSHPWIKLWKNDLLSSLNYQTLSVYEKGIYNQLLLLCRDEEYAGQFCWPNGKPLTLDEIVRGMHPKERERTDLIYQAINTLLDKGLIFWNKRKVLEIRKYAEKTEQEEQVKQCSTTGQPLVNHCNLQVSKNKRVKKSLSEAETDKDNKKNKNGVYQSILTYWNERNIITHKKLTDKMKRTINGRLDEGFTEAEIEQAITNYFNILTSDWFWWTHKWTMTDFLQRGIDKFRDWETAKVNYLKKPRKIKETCPHCKGKRYLGQVGTATCDRCDKDGQVEREITYEEAMQKGISYI